MDDGCLNKLPPPNTRKNITTTTYYLLQNIANLCLHVWSSMWTCRDGDSGRMSFYVLGEFAICTVSHSYRAGKWRKWVQSQVWCFGSWTLPWVHLNASLGDLLERLYRPGLHFLSPLCLRLMQIQHRHLASPHSPIYKLCIFDSRAWNAE